MRLFSPLTWLPKEPYNKLHKRPITCRSAALQVPYYVLKVPYYAQKRPIRWLKRPVRWLFSRLLLPVILAMLADNKQRRTRTMQKQKQMYVCMYVHVYVWRYVYVCMYMYTYVCMYVYVYVWRIRMRNDPRHKYTNTYTHGGDGVDTWQKLKQN